MYELGESCGCEGEFEAVTGVASPANEVGGCWVGVDGVEKLELVFGACVDVGGSC